VPAAVVISANICTYLQSIPKFPDPKDISPLND
jgi:hypothetical protein